MRKNKTVPASVIVALLLIAVVARAAADEKTITGVITKVDPTTRIATVTPAGGRAFFVHFAFNAAATCAGCRGSGRSGPTFAETVTVGSAWTLTYTSSI